MNDSRLSSLSSVLDVMLKAERVQNVTVKNQTCAVLEAMSLSLVEALCRDNNGLRISELSFQIGLNQSLLEQGRFGIMFRDPDDEPDPESDCADTFLVDMLNSQDEETESELD